MSASGFTKLHSSQIVARPVAEVVADLVKAKEAAGLSEVYLRDLRGRLGRFAEAFQYPIGMILANEIQNYLRDLKRGPRSNYKIQRKLVRSSCCGRPDDC